MDKKLYENALKAIAELFNDTSVSVSETKESLNDLIGEIQVMLDALETDQKAE
jgi:hypothetical protein